MWLALPLLAVPLGAYGDGEAVFLGKAEYPTEEITITDGYYYWDQTLNDGNGAYIRVTPANQDALHPLPLTVPSFNKYIYSVVRKEISNPGGADEVRNRIWGAQAVAAVSKALTTSSMISSNSINGTEDVQALEWPEWSDSDLEGKLEIACGVVLNAQQAIKYRTKKVKAVDGGYAVLFDDEVVRASYFGAYTSFTRNSEDYVEADGTRWNYSPYLRRSDSGPGIQGDLPDDLHCVGMSQRGMMAYANAGLGYEEIISKFYHPSPPIVREVRVLVDSEVKWRSQWIFNDNKTAPARAKTTDPRGALPVAKDLRFEILTSESMAHKSAGTGNIQEGASLFTLALKYDGNSKTHEIPLSRTSADAARRSYAGTLTSTKMKELGMVGDVTLSLDGYHFYATTWRLDKNPATVSFDGSSSYEVGADENHVIQITCPVELESASIGEEPVSGRTHVLTLNFVETVKNVSVVAPEGLVKFKDVIGNYTLSEDPAEGKVFTGHIDLGDVCRDGQKLCLTVRAQLKDCPTAMYAEAEHDVVVPSKSDVADLQTPASVPISPAPDCSNVDHQTKLSFGAPVMNVAVVPTIVAAGGGEVCIVNASQGTLEHESAQAARSEWTACLTYRLIGEVASGTDVSNAEVKVTWEEACDSVNGAKTEECLGPTAHRDHPREPGTDYISVSFTVGSKSVEKQLVQWFEFEEFIGNLSPSWEPVPAWNLQSAPADDTPTMNGNTAKNETKTAIVHLSDPGVVEASIQGGGVSVSAELVEATNETAWELSFKTECDAEGLKVLLLKAVSCCGTEYYKIAYNAGPKSCAGDLTIELDGVNVTGSYIPKDSDVVITGLADVKSGNWLCIHNPKNQFSWVSVKGTTDIAGCIGRFHLPMKLTESGQYKVFGVVAQGSKTPCSNTPTINADPTFMEDGRSQPPEPSPSLVKAYLSPDTSPGVKDTGVLAPGFGEDGLVTARVIDAEGVEIRRLLDDEKLLLGGFLEWDGKDGSGDSMPDGTYRLLVEGRGLSSGLSLSFMAAFIVDNTNPRAEFNRIDGMPVVGQSLQVYGAARDDNFKEGEVRAITSTGATIFLDDLEEPVVRGPIGVLPNDLPAGPVLLVLTVRDLAGNETRTYFRFNIREPESLVNLRITVDDITGQVVSGQGQFVPDNPDMYIDDQATMPEGITLLPEGGWHFARAPDPVFTGRESHTSGPGAGHRVHYFIHADEPLLTDNVNNDLIIQYVYLSASVQQIMLQFFTGNGDGEHRAYWGLNKIQTTGVAGTASLKRMGDLPPAGKWVRLRIPAKDVGVEGVPVKGIAFHVYGDARQRRAS